MLHKKSKSTDFSHSKACFIITCWIVTIDVENSTKTNRFVPFVCSLQCSNLWWKSKNSLNYFQHFIIMDFAVIFCTPQSTTAPLAATGAAVVFIPTAHCCCVIRWEQNTDNNAFYTLHTPHARSESFNTFPILIRVVIKYYGSKVHLACIVTAPHTLVHALISETVIVPLNFPHLWNVMMLFIWIIYTSFDDTRSSVTSTSECKKMFIRWHDWRRALW